MAVNTTYTDPSTSGGLDLSTGDTLTETVWDKVLSNLKAMGGTANEPTTLAWTPVWDTWAYASATTITVPAGAAAIYSVGDKIRFQNNNSGTYLYNTIKTVADTLLTVNVANVPNAVLTDVYYYSKAKTPTGAPYCSMVGASVYSAAAQANLTNNTWTKVVLDTEAYDLGGNFATSTFTVPVHGYYQINACVTFDSGDMVALKQYGGAVYVDGAAAKYSFQHSGVVSAAISCPIATMLELNAAQTVELWARQVSGGNTIDIAVGATLTWLSVTLLHEV